MKSFLLLLALAVFTTANTQHTTLLNFGDPSIGTYPQGSLLFDGTFFYGMTWAGGANSLGTVFKIKPDGSEYATLLDFAGGSNGSFPRGSLISDGTFLYGMTQNGGASNLGTVFKLKSDGSEYARILDFTLSIGCQPFGSLFYDGTYLFGMTLQCGTNDMGVVFKVKPDGTDFTKLLDFTGMANGSYPYGSLISDGTYLYGMVEGGTNNQGTIFKLKKDGTDYVKIYDFAGAANGLWPRGDLLFDGTYLYGMARLGGSNNLGTIFKLKPDGSDFTKLFDFAVSANGKNPYGSLIMEKGILYGMTYAGGTSNLGTIFQISPDGTGFTKLFSFTGPSNGQYPYGSLVSNGNALYGMTYGGGVNGKGVLFSYELSAAGIHSDALDYSIDLYPNPFAERTVLLSEQNLQNATLRVFDYSGHMVKEMKNISGQQIELSRENIESGMYILQLTQENQFIATRKLSIVD